MLGPKNIGSSSGCAIRSKILLPLRVGKVVVRYAVKR